jgi:hypothetical protein
MRSLTFSGAAVIPHFGHGTDKDVALYHSRAMGALVEHVKGHIFLGYHCPDGGSVVAAQGRPR